MKKVAIIQARMGSTRLPHKALLKILNKPMLWHILKRVNKSRLIDEVIIACTIKPEDLEIEKFAIKNKLKCYRGEVDDIVDRFYQAAKFADADIIIRLWGDCPLIDPALIDKGLERFICGNFDYANNFNPPTYPVGMNYEIYSFNLLEKIWNETQDKFFREYPFEYIYSNEDKLKSFYEKTDKDLSNIHLTVDYQEDFEIITKIFEELYKNNQVFHLDQILEFLKNNKNILNLNKNLRRNIEYTDNLDKRK